MARSPKTAELEVGLQPDLEAEERRGFLLTDHLLHDGQDLHPGDTAWLTEAQLDQLRRAAVLDAGAGWMDGERQPSA